MFNVILGAKRAQVHPFTVQIHGCPNGGIAAVDFRRSHGIPAAPTNKIELPGHEITDEEFCRAHPNRCNSEADIVTEYDRGAGGKVWSCNAVGDVYSNFRFSLEHGPYASLLPLSPHVIRDYVAAQTPETVRALLLDLWQCEARSLQDA